MFSKITQSLIENHDYAVIDEKGCEVFLTAQAFSVLFFPGDAARLAESDDVAVILPELMTAFSGRITPAVVARGEAERSLQRRYRFNAFPALVFLRRQGYLGVISGVRDWPEFRREISEILLREPSEPPPFAFPKGCNVAGTFPEPQTLLNAETGEVS